MLNRPNPVVLVMGGGALLTCSGFFWGTKLPVELRYAGMVVLILMGIASIGLGIRMGFKKKEPEAKPQRTKRAKEVTLGPGGADTKARRASAGGRSSRDGS